MIYSVQIRTERFKRVQHQSYIVAFDDAEAQVKAQACVEQNLPVSGPAKLAAVERMSENDVVAMLNSPGY